MKNRTRVPSMAHLTLLGAALMIVGFQNCAVQSDSALKHSGDIKIGLATPEASEEVKAAFVRILGRLPSSAELQEWTDALDSGSTLEDLMEELMRQAMSRN